MNSILMLSPPKASGAQMSQAGIGSKMGYIGKKDEVDVPNCTCDTMGRKK